MGEKLRVLVTGATGFVGAHLHERLRSQGHEVVGASRHPEKAQKRHPDRTFRQLDLADEGSIAKALEGIDVAVYLVHSMAETKDFERVEERSARSFIQVAEATELKRIVYLGGVQPEDHPSPHLRSRMRTGELLRSGRVPCIELQASMIIGAGSESFRIVRDLAARLPVMILPRWLETRTEPVALDDVLVALTRALDVPCDESVVYALPGPEIMSGREILERTSNMLGMEPRMVGVPLLSPRLSSYWITLVTRADKHVSRELVEGLTSDLVAADAGFWARLPEHQRLPFEEAVRRALAEEDGSLGWRSRLFERVIYALSAHTRDVPRPPRAVVGGRP